MPAVDIVDGDGWTPRRWHGVDGVPRQWRVTDLGLEVRYVDSLQRVRREPKPRRTTGAPSTLRRIHRNWRGEIEAAADRAGLAARHHRVRGLGGPPLKRWVTPGVWHFSAVVLADRNHGEVLIDDMLESRLERQLVFLVVRSGGG